MRVLLFTDTFPHLTETFVVAHARALDADVVSLYGDASQRNALGFTDPERYHILAPEGVAALRAQPQLQRFKQWWTGAGVRPWPRRIARRFEQILRARKPDIVLAEFGYNAMYCQAAVKRQGIPLVTHFHGADSSKYLKRAKYRRALPALFDDSCAVIVVSTDMARRIGALGCPNEKMHVIPCGADIARFTPIERTQRHDGGCRYVAVGRFVEFKGPLYTVEAFAHCRSQAPCHLTMIGDGPLLAAARGRAEALGVSADIDFRGQQNHQQVLETLENSDVFVHHALTSQQGQSEGWGVAIAEASATAMPSVATRHGGIPDQIIDGETGFLVPEGDTDAMAARMQELAIDPARRAAMGRKARKLIESVGDQRVQARKLARVLALHAGSQTNHRS